LMSKAQLRGTAAGSVGVPPQLVRERPEDHRRIAARRDVAVDEVDPMACERAGPGDAEAGVSSAIASSAIEVGDRVTLGAIDRRVEPEQVRAAAAGQRVASGAADERIRLEATRCADAAATRCRRFFLTPPQVVTP
jgi:hypothetical protein